MPVNTAGKASLLIVEDDADLRYLLRGALAPTYFCVAVATAEEALESLAEQRFDVILTDVLLPGISGLELVRNLSRLHPGVCVVVMSGAPLDSRHEWSALGVSAYLGKPFLPYEVERLVARAAAQC